MVGGDEPQGEIRSLRRLRRQARRKLAGRHDRPEGKEGQLRLGRGDGRGRRRFVRRVAYDLKALKPDLIVYGYGTNEGFNGNLDQQAYKAYAQRFVDGLRRNAPDADIVFIGAADGARKGSGQGCGGAWATPAKLDSVREAVSAIADAGGHGYWNWGEAMGGRCGISSWVSKGLAAKDHVHLTSSGYDRSAAAFYDYLVKPLGGADAVAFNR